MQEGPWTYDQLWIQLRFAGLAVSFVTGAAFFARGWAKIVELAAHEGDDSPAVQERIRRLVVVCFFDLGVLLAVVFEMTVKPTVDDEAALAVTALLPVFLVTIGCSSRAVQPRARPRWRNASPSSGGKPARGGANRLPSAIPVARIEPWPARSGCG